MIVELNDRDVYHKWTKTCSCDKPATVCVEVAPNYYEHNGVPKCSNCGTNMKYIKTTVCISRLKIN